MQGIFQSQLPGVVLSFAYKRNQHSKYENILADKRALVSKLRPGIRTYLILVVRKSEVPPAIVRSHNREMTLRIEHI